VLTESDVAREHPDHLRDESRLVGCADSISFPKSEAEVCATLARMSAANSPITIQGARTGIAGGAVPRGGHVLSFDRMTQITGLRHDRNKGSFHVIVQPGVLLSQLRLAIESKEFDTAGWSSDSLTVLTAFKAAGQWFFPPDPTETSAAIGGMVASNASGACSFTYGPTRDYVVRLRIAIPGGALLEITRGSQRASKRSFHLISTDGRAISGEIPSYTMPAVKNASGYFAADNMDVIDMFIGSEGTLGVLTEIELRLLPAPSVIWAVMAFFPDQSNIVQFVDTIRRSGLRPAAMEFFDDRALALLRRHIANNPGGSSLPTPPAGNHTAVYVEYHGQSEAAVSDAVTQMTHVMKACGGSEDNSWMATDQTELEKLKAFRHAIPEAVNMLIDQRRKTAPSITKLGTDMAVPDSELANVLAMYHADLDAAGLEYVIFGHIGNNHLHVNILPRNLSEYQIGKDLCLSWARRVIAVGGTVSAEHGIGKLKVALLAEMYGGQGIAGMQALKKTFDPAGILNKGNLF
jgi:D-lactate dehydrogenase (cytochrome)